MYKYLKILNHVESLIQEGEYKDGISYPLFVILLRYIPAIKVLL